MSSNQFTFWRLINECSIEIPTIQRDYTYGRKKAKEISEKLIDSILISLQIPDSLIHLDFVYGKKIGIENFKALERNKLSIDTLLQSIRSYADNLNLSIDYQTTQKNSQVAEVVTFIPLDGQQRLTTLFLIHWFIANLRNDNNAKKILNRFNYATRTSSREFLNLIVSTNHSFNIDNGNLLSDCIENHEAFFSVWKKDPTVVSMLVVLNEIQKQFTAKKLDSEVCWKKLTNDSLVTFDFFDLDDFELTDELYLKMNARGKKLTDFENFKAWLIKNYSSQINIPDWKKKIDLEWNDLFWNEKEIGETKIDSAYLQFFKNMFLGDYLLNKNESESESDKDELIDLLRLNSEYNPVSTFETSAFFPDKISDYLFLLNSFSTSEINIDLNPVFINQSKLSKLLFHKNQSLNWWDTTFFFAVTRYIIANNGSVVYLNQWIRVISNLIYNTPIESPKLYVDACKSILDLIEKLKDKNVYEYFKDLNSSEIGFFTDKQRNEEIKKSEKIINEPQHQWETLFISLEKHIYFYGQIGFMFDLTANETFEEFKKVSKKLSMLYSEEVMNDGSYTLFRSLLTFGNCFFENGDTLTYPSNVRGTLRNRNENWRKFFDSKITFLNHLMTEIDEETKNVISVLENQIYLKNDNEDHFSEFIKNPMLLNYPQNNHIRRYNKGYYLLSKTRIYGYFTELYTYNWFLNNQDYCKQNNLTYQYGKGEDSIAGIFHDENILFFDNNIGKYKINGDEYIEDNIEDAVFKIKVYA